MTAFATAYLTVWLVITLYVVRLGTRQRCVWRALAKSATVAASHFNQQSSIRH